MNGDEREKLERWMGFVGVEELKNGEEK